jgi:NAD(P)-dependent dehydrogenase (short-subunit alcohol dehydrogenase family)
MKVRGKVLVVTGAGNGVGRAVALEAIRRGAKVAGVDVSEAGLDETAALAGPVALPEGADVEKLARDLTTPESAANQILDGMEKNAYRVLIGGDAKLMEILYRVYPRGRRTSSPAR